jgi:PAS domain S-box-containing protein/diguanylate cyclase (GGDEF)-like protein
MSQSARPLQSRPRAAQMPRIWIVVLAFLVMLLGIGASGYVLFDRHAREMARTAQGELDAIADLKVRQIDRWVGEQRKDAQAIQRDNLLVNEVQNWFLQGAPAGEMADAILARLALLRETYGFKSVALLDAKARPRMLAGAEQKLDSHDTIFALRAMRENAVARPDIDWSDDRKPEMDMVAPLAVSGTQGAQVIGAVYIHIDPAKFFFPYVQSWPTPSPSAETFLVRREGDEVVFLNELRHRKGTALNMRLPIDQPLLPAAIALRGETEIRSGESTFVEGEDYRGVAVIAAARKVPDTPWTLIAKLDRAEINAPIRGLAATAGGLAGLFIVLAGAVAVLWWRKQRAQYVGTLYQAELERQALEQHFDYATKLARDIILLFDETGRVVECNESALAAYGYTRDEMLGLSLSELRADQAVAAIPSDLERAARAGGVTFETVNRRKDGSVFPIESSMRRIEVEGQNFIQGIARDITERKAAALRINHLTRLYAMLSHTNQAIVRAPSEQELYDQLCRIGVEHGGMLGSIVRIADTEAKLLHVVAFTESMRSVVENVVASIDPALTESQSLLSTAYLDDRVVIDNDYAVDDSAQHWKLVVHAAGVRSAAGLPIRRGGKPIGSLVLNAAEPNFFDEEMRGLLEEMTTDIEYALDNFEDERRRKQAEQALLESEGRFRGLVEQSISGITIIQDGRYAYVNPRAAEIFGFGAPEELIGREWAEVVVEKDRGLVAENIRRRLSGEVKSVAYTFTGRRKDGTTVDIGAHGAIASYGGVPATIAVIQDITERKAQEERIARLTRMHASLSGINAMIVRTKSREALFRDACRVMVETGKLFFSHFWLPDSASRTLKLTARDGVETLPIDDIGLDEHRDPGWPGPAECFLQNHVVVVNDLTAEVNASPRRKAMVAHGCRAAVCLPLQWGGSCVGVLSVGSADIDFFDAEELKLLAELTGDIAFSIDVLDKGEQLQYLALHDPLTGLANRAMLLEQANAMVATANDKGSECAVVAVNLKRFRNVNESLGRHVGDELLKQVGFRLAAIAGHAQAARLGADLFCILAPDVAGLKDATRFSKRVRAALMRPYDLTGRRLHVAIRIGVAVYPTDGADGETLCANAEATLRRTDGLDDTIIFYKSELNARVADQLDLENRMQVALQEHQFVLHYQPKVNAVSGEVVGAEALIRWQDPKEGLIAPGRFIPVLEETGLIVEVGDWALEAAARTYEQLRTRGLACPKIAVNISTIQMRRADFPREVIAAVRRGSGEQHGVDLEITESLMAGDIEEAVRKLKLLSEAGFDIAVDDFGTGYSSLGYLAKLPIKSLKIDRSFIITMVDDANAMAIVSTIINLAHSFQLKVVAEGVDKEEQLKLLRLLRCDEIQGFLFHKPLLGEQFAALLKNVHAAPG